MASPGDKLYVSQSLNQGQHLQSRNGSYSAHMRKDGNFVVSAPKDIPTWQSNTWRKGTYITLQEDGDLVVYDAKHQPKWSSNTSGKDAVFLSMQNDGNLVLEGRSGQLWASNTSREQDQLRAKWEEELRRGGELVSRNGQYQAVMQHDGNFVVYKSGRQLWASGTKGSGAEKVILQADGNVVVCTSGDDPTCKWASGTDSTGATHLIMQDDGNLVLYNNNKQVWASNTSQF